MKNTKREKAVEAGREVRRIQREYLREVAREMKEALEAMLEAPEPCKWHAQALAREAIAKARRLGL